MEFKKFSAGKLSYGIDDPDPKTDYAPGVTNVNFEDSRFAEHLQDENHENNEKLKSFLEALGLCHTVITDTKTDKASG